MLYNYIIFCVSLKITFRLMRVLSMKWLDSLCEIPFFFSFKWIEKNPISKILEKVPWTHSQPQRLNCNAHTWTIERQNADWVLNLTARLLHHRTNEKVCSAIVAILAHKRKHTLQRQSCVISTNAWLFTMNWNIWNKSTNKCVMCKNEHDISMTHILLWGNRWIIISNFGRKPRIHGLFSKSVFFVWCIWIAPSIGNKSNVYFTL